MQNLKFSVITVSYNQGEFIRDNIESVLRQNYSNFEHIIMDAGSTDETLSVLKEYPHLKWISEADRGQSHALNKAFKLATGDVIAWLNSDDFYPDGVFEVVNLAMQNADSEVVIGQCAFCDREGKQTQVRSNFSRNWFDILKYWVYESVPAQPAIFFKRAALDQIELINNQAIDESIDFCMDYEFWLRLTKKFPMQTYLPRVLANFREYDTNKTGAHMDVTYAEGRSVYRKHSLSYCQVAHTFSFIIPINEISDLKNTITSIALQSFGHSVEIMLVDYSNDRSVSKFIRNIRNLSTLEHRNVAFKYKRSDQRDYLQAFHEGVLYSAGEFVIPVTSAMTFSENFCLNMQSIFERDNVSASIFTNADIELEKQLVRIHDGYTTFKMEGLFTLSNLLIPCVFRKLAYLEMSEFYNWSSGLESLLFLRQYLLGVIYKGWTVHTVNAKGIVKNFCTPYTNESELVEVFRNYINSAIIDQLSLDFETDQFVKTRAVHGFTFNFAEQVVKAARSLLSGAPQAWSSLNSLADKNLIDTTSQKHPNFSPYWYVLSQFAKNQGQSEDADNLYNIYLRERANEFRI